MENTSFTINVSTPKELWINYIRTSRISWNSRYPCRTCVKNSCI